MRMEDFSQQEWREILLLITFLGPFYQVTQDLQGEKYPTLSLAYLLIHVLTQKIKDFDCSGIVTSVK